MQGMILILILHGEWLPDMSFQAYKASFSVAVAMKVVLIQVETFAISSVQLTMKLLVVVR